jgi:hypothetical protein
MKEERGKEMNKKFISPTTEIVGRGEMKTEKLLSNRLLYTFIILGILILSIGGVYGWPASGAGHNSDEIDFSSGLTLPGTTTTTAPILLNVGGAFNGEMKIRHLNGKMSNSVNAGDLYLQYGLNYNTILNAGESTGKVGIGTIDPTEKLEVAGTVKATRFILGDGSELTSSGSGLSQWTTSGSDIYYNTGKVGIGTTSPTQKLMIQGTSGASGEIVTLISNSATDVSARATLQLNTGYSNKYWQWFSRGGDLFAGIANVKDYLVIQNTTGNVGIGTTSPNALLSVAYNANPVHNAYIDPAGSGSYIGMNTNTENFINFNNSGLTSGGRFWRIGTRTNAGDKLVIDKLNNAATIVTSTPFVIDNFGRVGIGTTDPTEKLDVAGNVKATSFLYSSDKSLKTNIQPLTNSLNKVKQLEGVSFNWKENGEQSIGLIAQDVEKVFPELVSSEEGNKAVAYGNLVAVLIEAVKEQQKQIDELKVKCN